MSITFIDLFAGAGGFSEGFLQATAGDRRYDFLLASDINENCELTHRARYNVQLGIDLPFLRMDIKDPGFVPALVARLRGRPVDVICGGPPCQSFSLAGRRRQNDKKDDLFASYLEVVRALRPKYFAMENVTGILTKDGGAHRERILADIASIVDLAAAEALVAASARSTRDEIPWLAARVRIGALAAGERDAATAAYFERALDILRDATSATLSYKESKTSPVVGTVRHGLRMLARSAAWDRLRAQIAAEKSRCDIDNDRFVDGIDAFLDGITPDAIGARVCKALRELTDLAPSARAAIDAAVAGFVLTPGQALDRIAQVNIAWPSWPPARACTGAPARRCWTPPTSASRSIAAASCSSAAATTSR